jgi:predicted ATPase
MAALHTPLITTPDRRVRVFVSSTLGELADDRRAANAAITALRLTPVMFEVGARTHPARDLYRAYLEQSDVFVGIYGESYGWVAPSESISGLEDEYALAGERPKLIYVKTLPHRDNRLSALLARIRRDDRVAYKHYEAADELVDLLSDDLAVLLTERFTGGKTRASSSPRPASLPTPVTRIVGREREIDQVLSLVRDPTVRLVTLIGPGGIGKTRLALEIARLATDADVVEEASFIDLAAVADPDLWQASVSSTLGIHAEGGRPMLEVMIDRLQGRRLLLVVDNVEQIVSAAGDLGRLLASCRDLKVLVTSRIALRLRGEHEVPLAPLATPTRQAKMSTDAIAQSPAVMLLVDLGKQVRPGFELTASNAGSLAELANLLDGMPLALELAAAHLRLLTPAALVERLSAASARSLDMVAATVDTPPRQRTLRATIEWSYSLLGEAERALFARLSVFVGAWTLEAMQAVGVDDHDDDPLVVLASLVSQSLVRTDDADPDEARFRMLGTIRTFANERLVERGESEVTFERLTRYLLGVVELVRDDLQGIRHREAAARVDRERDEIFSAMSMALRNDDAGAVGRLLTPLFTYWWSRGLLAATNDYAEKAAALPSAAGLDAYGAALLSGARGMSLITVGRAAEAEVLLTSTLSDATSVGNDRLRAYALLGLGGVFGQRDAARACERLDQAIELFRANADDWGLSLSLSTRGSLTLVGGDRVAAHAMHIDALDAATRIDNDLLRAQVLGMLGLDALASRELDAARSYYALAVDLHLALEDYEGSAYCLFGLGEIALALDRPDAAATLVGASRQARTAIGAAIWPSVQSSESSQEAALVGALGREVFDRLASAGENMQVSEALTYGLSATK